MAGIPDWLFDESYHIVGDLAETIASILPNNETESQEQRPLTYWIEYLIELKDAEEDIKKEKVLHAWSQLSRDERFVFNKIVTGGFRVGVSEGLMVKSIGTCYQFRREQYCIETLGQLDTSNYNLSPIID